MDNDSSKAETPPVAPPKAETTTPPPAPKKKGDYVKSIYGHGIVDEVRRNGTVCFVLDDWLLANNSRVKCYLNPAAVDHNEGGEGGGDETHAHHFDVRRAKELKVKDLHHAKLSLEGSDCAYHYGVGDYVGHPGFDEEPVDVREEGGPNRALVGIRTVDNEKHLVISCRGTLLDDPGSLRGIPRNVFQDFQILLVDFESRWNEDTSSTQLKVHSGFQGEQQR